MAKLLTKGRLSVLIILCVLVIDQVIKIAVKTHMYLYERISVCGDWFYILFTENNGMAFGMEIFGKSFLSSFRILAVILIGYYIYNVVKQQIKTGYIVCLSLIWAGAMGNILDSVFYGLIFDQSLPASFWNSSPAQFVPFGEGYSTWLHGKVVDMFYFPLIQSAWPEWMPLIGGEEFIFFSPVFNFADASISCGMIALLLFYRKELEHTLAGNPFGKKKKETDTKESQD